MNYSERLSKLRNERTGLEGMLDERLSRPGEEAELQIGLIKKDLGRVNREIILLPLQRFGEMLGIRRTN
jgi:hypothetical protein